jgi:hypothetical protein
MASLFPLWRTAVSLADKLHAALFPLELRLLLIYVVLFIPLPGGGKLSVDRWLASRKAGQAA